MKPVSALNAHGGEFVPTGTPCHSRALKPGGTVEVEVTNIGHVGAHVVSAPKARRVALGHDERVPDRFKDNDRAAALGKD